MDRVQTLLHLETPPLPADYFDLIGGTSTGGSVHCYLYFAFHSFPKMISKPFLLLAAIEVVFFFYFEELLSQSRSISLRYYVLIESLGWNAFTSDKGSLFCVLLSIKFSCPTK